MRNMRACAPVCVSRICASWEAAPAEMYTHTHTHTGTLSYTALQEEVIFYDLLHEPQCIFLTFVINSIKQL